MDRQITLLEVELFTCHGDNFGVLLHDPTTGVTASIDAPEEKAILDALARRNWTLHYIFTTHHHHDHIEANLALKSRYDLEIIGPWYEGDRIPGIDRTVKDGDSFEFAGHSVDVIHTPGHTLGHVCFHFPQEKLLFAADTLFALGCGRLLEGTAEQMWRSLMKLAALPDETTVYFGHEYTLSNARFALTVDPENTALRHRVAEIEAIRTRGGHTAPTTIGLEKSTNPFLRIGAGGIRRSISMTDESNEEVFAELRRRKDQFAS